jgi:hypothetical protein
LQVGVIALGIAAMVGLTYFEAPGHERGDQEHEEGAYLDA